MGSLRFDPNAQQQPPQSKVVSPGRFDPSAQQTAPPASGDGGGTVSPGRFNPNAQQTGGGQQTAPDPGWGIDWSKRGGQVTMPQSVQDFGDVAGAEAWMGLPGLRTQAVAAARQRLGPTAAMAADVTGNYLSPTMLLNALPGGPVLAGAAHEGIKSAAAGNDLKTIAEDTVGGAGWGLTGYGAAKYAPKVLPRLAEEGVKMGAGYGARQLFGGWADAALPEGLGAIFPFMTGYGLTQTAGQAVGKGVEKIADWPVTKQAVQNLILGVGSSLRSQAGPWDQWIPGQ